MLSGLLKIIRGIEITPALAESPDKKSPRAGRGAFVERQA